MSRFGNDFPTMVANDDFDAESAATVLKDAMKGLGTDEENIIQTLTSYNSWQREEIEKTYKQCFGENLVDDLKGELGGHFEDVCIALLDHPRVYDAKQLNRAISGIGTKEDTIIEILCSRRDEEIEEIKEKYKELYDNELEDDVKGDLGGNLERLMVSLLNAGREDGSSLDGTKAEDDARELYEAGAAQWGTDESVFNKIMCTRNYNQLRLLCHVYLANYEKTLQEEIESEFSDEMQLAYKSIVTFVDDEEKFFAGRLHDAISGAGTNEHQLIRVIVGRSEIDLGKIKEVYESEYEKPLAEAIEDDCGGDFKKILLALVAGNNH